VAQFDREASQTRNDWIAKSAIIPGGSPRSFTAQRALVQDDK